MNFKKNKSQKNNSSLVRKIGLSLKLKLTMMVIFMLILTVGFISVFIIQHQNRILDNQMEENMTVYLETFKSSVSANLLDGAENRQQVELQDYVESYNSIENFKMAMFSDCMGNNIVHSAPGSVGSVIAQVSKDRMFDGYEKTLHFEERFITNTEVNSLYVTNVIASVKTNIIDEQTNFTDIKTTNVCVAKLTNIDGGTTNIKTVKVTNVLVIQNADAFMPVYLSDAEVYTYTIGVIDDYLEKFHSGALFKTRNAISTNVETCLPLADDVQNAYQFMSQVNSVYNELVEEGGPSEKMYNLEETGVISWADYEILVKRRSVFNTYYGKEWNIEFSDESMESTFEILSELGVSEDSLADFRKMRRKNELFSTAYAPETQHYYAISFINYVEDFIDKYWDTEKAESTEKLESLIDYVEKDLNVNGWEWVDRDYYYQSMIDLVNLYDNKLLPYLSGETLYDSDIEEVFKNLYAIYRLGSVRIIINFNDVYAQREEVVLDTIDISLIFIIRMILIAFIIVALMIAPLNVLGAETEGIVEKLNEVKVDASVDEFNDSMEDLKEYLEKPILIKAKDEFGQLADKFNTMTGKFKTTFEEIERKQGELDLAKQIQSALLPKSAPEIPGFEFSVYYEPQSESGGDYYDYIDVDDNQYKNRFGIVVADVTNHGVGAAMVMASLRSTIRTYAAKTKDARKVLRSINPVIHRDTPSNMFATVFYGVIEWKTTENGEKEYEIYYSIAGHEQGIIYNLNTEKMSLLQIGGMPVGVVPSEIFDPNIQLFKYVMKPGDIFIQYSDGITEAKNEQEKEFEEERFMEVIKQHASANLDEMRDSIIAEVESFRGKAQQSDDITLIMMKLD